MKSQRKRLKIVARTIPQFYGNFKNGLRKITVQTWQWQTGKKRGLWAAQWVRLVNGKEWKQVERVDGFKTEEKALWALQDRLKDVVFEG